MSKFKKYLALLLLSLGGGTIYIVPYYKYNYYDALMQASGLNNTQLGVLLAVYGSLAMIFYLPGGAIADKFSARILFTFSMISTGLLTLWYGTMPGYTTILIIHGLMAVTTVLTFWSAFLKGVRALGTKEEQGRMYGLSDMIRGIAGAGLSFILLAVIGKATTDAVGVKDSLYLMGIIYITIGVLTFFLMPRQNDTQANGDNDEPAEKLSLKSVKTILKMPAIWLISLNIFFWYVAYSVISYAVPYLTQGFGLSSSMAGTVGILRMYLISIFAAPIAGFLADKMKSPSKLLIYLGILCTILTALFVVIPTKVGLVTIMIVITLAVGGVIAAARGIYFATMAETKIPLYVTGLATGIISIISYSPDLFMQVMIGQWLDKYGLFGYKLTFLWMTVCLIGAIITAILIRKTALKTEKVAN